MDNDGRFFGVEAQSDSERPEIVCLCGSTRFWQVFRDEGLRLTLEGKVVLSIGSASAADDDDKTFGGYVPEGGFDEAKRILDRTHLWKVRLADRVRILNVGGYIGDSTRRELAYARYLGKPVEFLEPVSARHSMLVKPRAQHS